MAKFYFVLLLVFALFLTSCSYEEQRNLDNANNSKEVNQKEMLKMRVSSPSFKNFGRIPDKYTCKGLNVNPEINIEEVPSEAKSLVLIIDDPDAPMGTWDHWILFNIDPKVRRIKEDSVPENATKGINSFGTLEYGGPCPPSGSHRYFFKVYALDRVLDLSEGATKKEVERRMQGHIIDRAEIIGLYSK